MLFAKLKYFYKRTHMTIIILEIRKVNHVLTYTLLKYMRFDYKHYNQLNRLRTIHGPLTYARFFNAYPR